MKKILGIILIFTILLILPSSSVYGEEKELTDIDKQEISTLEKEIEDVKKDVEKLENKRYASFNPKTIKDTLADWKVKYEEKHEITEKLKNEYADITSKMDEYKKLIAKYEAEPDDPSSVVLLKDAQKQLKDLNNEARDYTEPIIGAGKMSKSLERAERLEKEAEHYYNLWAEYRADVQREIDVLEGNIQSFENKIATIKGIPEEDDTDTTDNEIVTDNNANQDEAEIEQVEVATEEDDSDENPVVAIAATTEAEDGYAGVETAETTSSNSEKTQVSDNTDSSNNTPSAGGSYTVVSGDSLSAIARRQLGDASRWPEIVELNKGIHPTLESNPNLIYSGWDLVLPESEKTQNNNVSAKTTTTNSDFIKADHNSVPKEVVTNAGFIEADHNSVPKEAVTNAGFIEADHNSVPKETVTNAGFREADNNSVTKDVGYIDGKYFDPDVIAGMEEQKAKTEAEKWQDAADMAQKEADIAHDKAEEARKEDTGEDVGYIAGKYLDPVVNATQEEYKTQKEADKLQEKADEAAQKEAKDKIQAQAQEILNQQTDDILSGKIGNDGQKILDQVSGN